jgi:Nuclease-related domain
LGTTGRLPADAVGTGGDGRGCATGLKLGLNLSRKDALLTHERGSAASGTAGAHVMLNAMTVSYPHRQQLRRLMRAARLAGGAIIASVAAVLLESAGYAGIAFSLGAVAVVFGFLSRRALRLAGRSRVGAESEAQVRRALEPLAREGWRVAHAVDWPGHGDLDHVLRSPSGMGFVIETKTLRYDHAHAVRTMEAARWLARRRRRFPSGVVPVTCVARARSLERADGNLLLVSPDRLLRALRMAAASRAQVDVRTGKHERTARAGKM